MKQKTITLSIGQVVAWKAAPHGFAQVIEFRRTRIRICYRCKNGNMRFAIVRAADVCLEQYLFEMSNPFDRGQIVRSKTFTRKKG